MASAESFVTNHQLATIEAFRATGRLAFVHKKRGQKTITVSLNGFADIPLVDAMRRMKELLSN